VFTTVLAIRKTSKNCWLRWFIAIKCCFRYKQAMYPC